MRTIASGVVAGLVVLAGCGIADNDVVVGESRGTPYTGPLHVEFSHADEASVQERSGAAGQALECETDAYAGGSADYDSGLASAQDSATEALENFFSEESWSVPLPNEGYLVEREDDGRVLFSYDVGGRTKVALIAADGMRDHNDDRGWGIETWAQCDPSELPARVTQALGIEVWEDASGRRVAVTKVQSFPGPEHCDWQDITFLYVGPGDPPDQYLRDIDGELQELLRTTFDADATLPERAEDTGFHHDGRRLWLDPEGKAAYLVAVEDPDDVERWPAAKDRIGCM